MWHFREGSRKMSLKEFDPGITCQHNSKTITQVVKMEKIAKITTNIQNKWRCNSHNT
jgi:hypothetical protein